MGGFPQGFTIAAFIPSPTLKGAAASGTPVCPRLREEESDGANGGWGHSSRNTLLHHKHGPWKLEILLYYQDLFLLFVPSLNLPEQNCLHNQMTHQGVKLNKPAFLP